MPGIVDWLHETIGIDEMVGPEVHTPCPKCDHPNFYFNVRKRLGHCFSADCGWSPNLKMLADHIGYGPDEDGYYQARDYSKPEVLIQLPEKAKPMIEWEPERS